jgi:SCY1-like protein 2
MPRLTCMTPPPFVAPEYALDEHVTAASDLYALGCILYAVHLGGKPPFSNHHSLSSMRSNMDRLARGEIGNAVAFARLTPDLKCRSLPSLLSDTSPTAGA